MTKIHVQFLLQRGLKRQGGGYDGLYSQPHPHNATRVESQIGELGNTSHETSHKTFNAWNLMYSGVTSEGICSEFVAVLESVLRDRLTPVQPLGASLVPLMLITRGMLQVLDDPKLKQNNGHFSTEPRLPCSSWHSFLPGLCVEA